MAVSPTMGMSPALQDLGLNTDTMQKTAQELDAIRKRKKLLGDKSPLGFSAATDLMGAGAGPGY